MRSRKENNDLSVHAIAGTRVVVLGLDLKHNVRGRDDGSTPSPSTLSAMLSAMTVADNNGNAETAPESSPPFLPVMCLSALP